MPHHIQASVLKEEFLGALDKMQKEYLDAKIRQLHQEKDNINFANISHEERVAMLEMIKKKGEN
jgi:ABC-type Fe3+/spermidine/putrescine transport system ATPase subunit